MEVISKKVTSNVLISIFAQIISIGTSFILNLIVPKYIPAIEYSMWQVYILYASFVGICHLGLMDGFLLKYSQYDYEHLDKAIAHSHFLTLIFILSFNSILLFVIGTITNILSESLIILVSVAVIVKNLCTFGLYIFQSTNRIGKYAKLVICQRIVYAIIVSILILNHEYNYILYCVADLIADIFGFFFSAIYNKKIYFGKIKLPPCHGDIVKNSFCAGVILMIANFSSNFIVGACKMVIEWTESKLVFGQIAFAFSVTNLALTFVIAISVVLFPSLKRINQSQLVEIYKSMRIIISEIMYFILLLYYPCTYILQKWLPIYAESFKYLVFLFPIILFSTKIVLLTNNYLKVFRMEKKLLVINVAAVLSEVFGLALFYSFKQIWLLLIWTVIVTYIKSVASEWFVSQKIQIDSFLLNLEDGLFGIVFIITTLLFPQHIAIIILILAFGIVSIANHNRIKHSIKFITKI